MWTTLYRAETYSPFDWVQLKTTSNNIMKDYEICHNNQKVSNTYHNFGDNDEKLTAKKTFSDFARNSGSVISAQIYQRKFHQFTLTSCSKLG